MNVATQLAAPTLTVVSDRKDTELSFSPDGLSYRVIGANRPGRALVLISPMASDMSAWGELPEAIAGRPVVLFDPPGIGRSQVGPLPYTPVQLCQWIVKMMDDIGHARFDVLGYSWGGTIAQEMALQFPHEVRRLVLAATGPSLSGVGFAPRHERRRRAMHTMQSVPELLFAYLQSAHRQRDPRGPLYQYLAVAAWASTGRLGSVVQPTLILAGDRDPIAPIAQAELLKAGIPNSRIEIVDGGHLFPSANAERVAIEVSSHLDV